MIIFIIVTILIVCMLIPIKSKQYTDTGYYALLYQVVFVHELAPAPHGSSLDTQITKGTQIYILSFKVYDDVETELYYPEANG